ncbi:preprotein translocase subunit SecY [Anaerotignum propionicum]|uniref:Protein translocase subunit SecY n=2 Tax=root TaxID=1 RepID=A0A0X8V8N4_ANAPI|nr:preprotein translocase subunit SecY [Anaerotignum propionicum]AMJ40161.1 protein translocase subunit SecY [Anaerotignum propionicum DSM 1682]SHF13892.1 protein translocase subunit secY/sec61 alpha [[Clostridium] propionicum DSM 1682] [Anaerotignum propionicum DSM 1682]
MFKIFVNSWRTKEIRNKILYTLMIFAIVRLGTLIALPGIDAASVIAARGATGVGTLYSVIAGGANSSWSLFAMGIGPYINASIIMQLLTIAIPKFEQLSKEGPEGRKKLQSYSRYLTVVLALIQGAGLTYTYQNMFLTNNTLIYAASVICLVTGSAFVMWLAEQITAKGIGNGSSMIIFINIVSNLPQGIASMYYTISGSGVAGVAKVAAILIILLVVLAFIVCVNTGERRLPVQYSSKMAGHKQMGGSSTTMPIKVNTAGVISIIFAISLLQFPQQIGNFIPNKGATFTKITEILNMTHPIGACLYIALILFFTYFYTSIVINPNEIAMNMKKNGGFIPGIRPGQPTSTYITKVVNRITLVGAICYSILAMVPVVLQWIFKINVGFGGTTLIIVVGVALDIVKSLESQLLMRHYKGFLSE